MAGITLAQAEAKLALYMTAADSVSSGKSYTIGDRSFTSYDVNEIHKMVMFWDKKVKELSESSLGRGRSRTVAPW